MAVRLQFSAPMHRVKNTIACEACRKRKSKCSGTAPCSACRKNGLLCEFRSDRQRRGPRPRAKDPSPLETELATASPPSPLLAGVPEEHDAIVLAMWSSCRDDVRAIIDIDLLRGQIAQSMAESTLLDVLCHLLELFWTHVHNQQWPILSPRLLYQSIKARRCPGFLCLAICAVTHRFSSHPALRTPLGSTSLDKTFAALARQQLYQLGHQDVARIQSLCILILYEAAVGQGSQAWADTAFARAAVDVMLSLASNGAEDDFHEVDMARTFLIAHQHLHALGHPSLSDSYREPTSSLWGDASGGAAIRLLAILLRVYEYTGFDSCEGHLPPWKSQSTFQLLWRELETFRLRNPDDVKPPFSLFEEIDTPSNTLAISLLSSLEWHCAVIILHRHLLAHVCSWVMASAMSAPPGPSLFSTPSSSFVKEHMKIGISSTLAVVEICAEIMRCGSFFLPPFLAYTCFQSAIFLINTLRCGLPDSEAKLEQILRINIAVLVMASEIYAPANAWIQTLEILRQAPISSQGNTMSQIPEPAFVPLDHHQPHHAPTNQGAPIQTNSQDPETNSHQPTSPAADPTQECNLLLDYQCMLDEDLGETAPQPAVERYPPPTLPSYREVAPGLQHGQARATSHPEHPLDGAPITPSVTAATIPVPHENQFISSLPAELLEHAFAEPSIGFDYGVDAQFLDMLFETNTLGSSSLGSVDLDGMHLWTPCLPRSESG